MLSGMICSSHRQIGMEMLIARHRFGYHAGATFGRNPKENSPQRSRRPQRGFSRNRNGVLRDLCAAKRSTRSSRRLCGLRVECFWTQRARRVCKLHSSTRRKSSRPEERADISNTEYGRPTRPASVLFTDLLGPKSLCENSWIPAYAGMTRVGIGRLSPAMSPPRRRGSILGNREARVFHTDS